MFTDFLNSLVVLFFSFSKAPWELQNRFSEATLELQTAFLNPPEVCTQISRRLQKCDL
jgi:hypothetical protein